MHHTPDSCTRRDPGWAAEGVISACTFALLVRLLPPGPDPDQRRLALADDGDGGRDTVDFASRNRHQVGHSGDLPSVELVPTPHLTALLSCAGMLTSPATPLSGRWSEDVPDKVAQSRKAEIGNLVWRAQDFLDGMGRQRGIFDGLQQVKIPTFSDSTEFIHFPLSPLPDLDNFALSPCGGSP